MGALSLIRMIVLHEGKQLTVTLETGEEREVQIKGVSVESRLSRKEFADLTPEGVAARIDDAASQMASKQAEQFYEEFNRAVTSVGNVVGSPGRPMDAEVIFEMIEKIHLDFGADGLPQYPIISGGGEFLDRFRKVLEEIETTPELRQRLQAVLNVKREEWRARESNRKLVG